MSGSIFKVHLLPNWSLTVASFWALNNGPTMFFALNTPELLMLLEAAGGPSLFSAGPTWHTRMAPCSL